MWRRDFLRLALALAASRVSAQPASSTLVADTPPPGGGPFDFAALKGMARAAATRPFQPALDRAPALLDRLGWDTYQSIHDRESAMLWTRQSRPFRVAFFHLGWHFTQRVRMFELVDGQSREIAYDPAMFDYGKSGLGAAELPRDTGFAGFRVLFHTDWTRDVAAFLGASYFRAAGGNGQYGLSARGLAVNCGMSAPEEFPNFTNFWLERPDTDSVTVYGLLDSPSVTGAYRFDIDPAATLSMDVSAALYPRRTIERIGIAPLTSMFLCGSNDRREGQDWRPQIHDSDGLALWTGRGEWIWRPLTNPAALRFNAYADTTPRGFGLLQRDRNFDHYQDDWAFYDLRPSAWVEPKGDWGKGSVQLVELPAANETEDNIVAFWTPDEKPAAGQELLFAYRLYWGAKAPFASSLAKVVATRTGIGGVIGHDQTFFSWRFVIDFGGEGLPLMGKGEKVEAVITASRGEVLTPSARPLASINGYRAIFDLRPPDADERPIDLRLYLRAGTQPLSETWMYQWTPPMQRPLA